MATNQRVNPSLADQINMLQDKIVACKVEAMRKQSESSRLLSEATDRIFELRKENDRLISLLHSKENKKRGFWSKLLG